jgi:hypothetical protein
MIPYEELVAALDRYVARNGGTPMSARASSAQAGTAHEVDMMPGYDEPHDPDLHQHGEDATHVGAAHGGETMPPPLQPVSDEGSNEIDIGDVLADDELN